MLLIAENDKENRVLDGLAALLCDMGIDTDSYREDEAIAVTFFSTDDLSINEEFMDMTVEEQSAFLHTIEDSMRAAMLSAGHKVISRALCHAKLGISHPDRYLKK